MVGKKGSSTNQGFSTKNTYGGNKNFGRNKSLTGNKNRSGGKNFNIYSALENLEVEDEEPDKKEQGPVDQDTVDQEVTNSISQKIACLVGGCFPGVCSPGEFYTIFGATMLTKEQRDMRKKLPAFVLCHMVVIYKLFYRGGIETAIACTITSQPFIQDLRNVWRIPIRPHDNSEWPEDDTHSIQFTIDNAVTKGENKTLSKNSCLRWDNAFHIPTSILRRTTGSDGRNCVVLNKESYACWDKLMVNHDIVNGSRNNAKWKVDEERNKRQTDFSTLIR